MNIAIIPARGGSKRIPRKNVKLFCGKPMIAWSIETALASGCFDHVIVSTDDAEIAKIAQQHGAEVPFIRPDELSDDYTGTGLVVKHACEWVERNIATPNFVCTIYATAAFVQATDLVKSLCLLQKSKKSVAFSVTSFPFPIQRAIKLSADGVVSMFQPEHYMTRSQDLEPAFHDAGQFYWSTIKAVHEQTPAFSEAAIAYILPRYRVQDIDTQEDWLRAEWMFNAIQQPAAE